MHHDLMFDVVDWIETSGKRTRGFCTLRLLLVHISSVLLEWRCTSEPVECRTIARQRDCL